MRSASCHFPGTSGIPRPVCLPASAPFVYVPFLFSFYFVSFLSVRVVVSSECVICANCRGVKKTFSVVLYCSRTILISSYCESILDDFYYKETMQFRNKRVTKNLIV